MPDARYAGLTYASVGGQHGAGGWQVHARSADLTDDDERRMLEHVVTAFDSHEGALAPFVEPAVVARLPVRFSAEPVEGGALIRHAVQAGPDATGRPGNVFTTVLLDRAAGIPPLPIRLWRSPDLLAPFGAAAVAEASPRWQIRTGQVVGAAGVAALLTDAGCWAPLAVLLDALAAAADGGPTVVLRARDQDDAARWIGTACLLTAPGWSARLRWSLYERGGSVHGLHIGVVPAGDEPPVGPDVVLLDPDEQPALGVNGGTDHETAAGVRVRATAWSELVTELFALDPDEVTALVEAVSATAGPGLGDPAWWLAVGLLGSDRCPADLAEAAAALLARSPAPSHPGAAALAVLGRALDDPVDGPAALRAALDAIDPDDGRSEVIAGRYVRAALADHAWLDSADAAVGSGRSAALGVEVVAPLLRGTLVDGDGSALLKRLTNTVDLLALARLLEAGDPRIDEPLADLVLMAGAAVERGDAPVLVAQLDRLPDAVRIGVLPLLGGVLQDAPVRPALPGGLGREQVLRLLGTADDDGATGLRAADALLVEGRDSEVAGRVAALLAIRKCGADRALLHTGSWATDDRLALAAAVPEAVDQEGLMAAVAAAGVDAVRLLVEQERLPAAVRDAVRLRLDAERTTAEGHWRLGLADDAVLTAADRLAVGGGASASAVLTAPMRLLPVVALLLRRSRGLTGATGSSFGQLLRRRASTARLDPLPVEAVQVLADRLSDEEQLTPALAYAAADRDSASDDALRRAVRTPQGDLLDLAIEAVLTGIGESRAMRVAAAAQELLSSRSETGRLDRLLRRSPGVGDYLDALGVDLPRRVR